MENGSRLKTAGQAEVSCLGYTDDDFLTGKFPVDEVEAERTVDLLPAEGYRILDAQSSIPAPLITPVGDRFESQLPFFTPELNDNRPPSSKDSLLAACRWLSENWTNVLLIFIPIGIFAPNLGYGDSAVFVLNCFAVIPLADVLCRATDDAASFLGETAGALLNVTMGNTTELAIFVHALLQRQYTIVRTSLLGSIIVNMLFVLGLSILVGETQMRGQSYNIFATRVAAGLLCFTTVSLLLPSTIKTSPEPALQKRDILALSRGTSIVLIVVYFIYLWTQMKSRKFSYKPLTEHDEGLIDPEKEESIELSGGSVHRRTLSYPRTYPPFPRSDMELQPPCLGIRDHPKLSLPAALSAKLTATIDVIKSVPWVRKAIPVVLILLSTCLISISGELLVSSTDHFVDHSPISKTMVGLIILPIVGNAAELISGIMLAYRKQMDLAFAVCIGSAIQMALFVAPLVVLLGWGMGREMSLHFSMFEAITLVASTVLFFTLVFDDRCSGLKGAFLLAGYTIISLASYFIPDTEHRSSFT